MFIYYPYLADEQFLKELMEAKNVITYARITILDINDNPIECIEGYVTQGSLSKNGSQAVRVSGSLTIIADDSNYQIENIDNIIAINKRVYIEIGRQNVLSKYTDYDVIWFPQGVMGVTQASIQHTTQNYTISLSFKDKMIFFNGELGGILPAPITFSPTEDITLPVSDRTQYPAKIATIIQTLVNELGGVPKEKIFINNLDEIITNICSWGTMTPGWHLNKGESNVSQKIVLDNDSGSGTVLNFGSIIGYTPISLVYPGELSSNAGDNIVSVLDKIKNTLGNFEYFFDINGNFIFQEIPNYLRYGQKDDDITHATEDMYFMTSKDSGRAIYSIDNTELISSISNTPQYAKIKNDFNVWGKRNNMPIRYHLVLDEIPVPPSQTLYIEKKTDPYTTADDIIAARYNGRTYINKVALTSFAGAVEISTSNMDWRTYIYLDYIRSKSAANYNSSTTYNINTYVLYSKKVYKCIKQSQNHVPTDTEYWEEYIKSPYAEELYANWPLLVNLNTITNTGAVVFVDDIWNCSYFLDMVDSSNPNISQFNISKIGTRSVCIKDDAINCLAYPKLPEAGTANAPIIFSAGTAETATYRHEYNQNNKVFIQVNKDIFDTCINKTLSSYSTYEAIRAALNEYVSYNETVSITAIPILYLEPNTRIRITDPETSVSGDYMIDTISISLGSNGNMQINAKRALEKI